jgi:hypothetical protein
VFLFVKRFLITLLFLVVIFFLGGLNLSSAWEQFLLLLWGIQLQIQAGCNAI